MRPVQNARPMQAQAHEEERPSPASRSDIAARVTTWTPWILLPMRLFLGITFVYAGVQKLMDKQFFNPSARGYIGKQIIGFANNTPLHGFLISVALPHATAFGLLVAVGEIAIGLGTLVGLLFRPAAFFGLLINILFFLSATWHVYPYFYGSDIVFAFCWLTVMIAGPENTGVPALDLIVASWLFAPEEQQKLAPAISFLLGIKEPRLIAEPVEALSNGRQASGNRRQAQRYAQRAKQQSRRSFIWGVVTGGAGIAVGALFLRVFRFLPGDEGAASPSAITSTTTASGTTTTSSGTSAVIAQISQVPDNSSAQFTVNSSGDPGVLVHLNNGQFVAYDAVCTHAGCTVSYDPGSQMLLCPCHGAAFDPSKAAAVVQGPAPTPLASVNIKVDTKAGTVSQQ